jgi:HSP20 family protein
MTTKTTVPVTKTETQLHKHPNLFNELREDLETLWDRPWLPFAFDRPRRRLARRLATWMPTMDVFEKEGELIIRADLPGMKKDEVQVLIEEGDLVLKGERKYSTEVKEEDYYRCEREYGEFYRRLALPFDADPNLIAAKFTDGVLEVKIPMPVAPKAAPKKINIM